ncbi:SHOCT domain-containing protein [Sphingobium sp. JS3065]|uniref:SHOCT domain-containing protein n=1 Tax=Sphingobium sp. JS3065 TaxID=2970925 RepID=UPI0022645DCD|nr:SHOCT domain-containing protein [Sphingobium sp. JS3065]UZW55653.1 SHOCT domain-containing protein [Sphingobium sp. JS3065]
MPMWSNGACRDAMWGGWMPFQGIFFLLLIVLAIIGLVALARSIFRSSTHGVDERRGSSSLEILEQRYAKGELEREEYLQKKTDLTAQS